MTMTAGYLAPEGFEPELLTELGDRVRAQHGRLVMAAREGPAPAWVANVWEEPQEIAIASIGDAVKKLKAIQRNWVLLPHEHHRRASLIAEQLPKVSGKPLVFGDEPPKAPLGSFLLLKPDLMLVSPKCSSPFPHGEARFVEDREAPPSRAYLKLWEALTIAGAKPGPGDTVLDLGSSPGGWTWVLASLGATVISVDKAPLEPRIAAMPGVRFRQESAFGLNPRHEASVDWLFSDVICYPARLLALVERWMAAGKAKRLVTTLKFQGETDFETAAKFAAIPGSRLVHLHHNKHELTWIKV